MTELSPSLDPQLLTELGWARRLARSLVRDQAVADDVAQEACLLALRHRPNEALGLRAWCATVVHNLVRQHARGARRRQEREALAAKPEPLAPTDDLVARAHAQRDLVEHVLALDEPYRSSVLLRFFEELPPREIARRLGVPVATVQSRLTRALRMLRARLDDRHGSRTWLAALLPLCAPGLSHSIVVSGLGGTVMNAKMTAVGSVLAVALSVGAYVMWDKAEPAAQESATRRAAMPSDGSRSSEATTPGTSRADANPARRTPTAGAVAPVTEAAAARAFTVRGRALMADGLPAGGIGLGLATEATREVGRTRGDGTFELNTTSLPVRVVVTDRDYVTLHAGACDRQDAPDALVVMARTMRISGRVVNENQQPLSNAHLRVALARDWASKLQLSLEATEPQTWTARSDGDGRFVFHAAPAVIGSTLRAVLDGYDSRVVTAPEQTRDDLEIVLTRPATPLTSTLQGRVLTPDGLGASEARVALGLTTTLADAKGFFALDLSRAVTAEQLRAVKEGFQPAFLDRPAGGQAARAGWPEYIELRLGAAALTMHGKILDHEGKPVADALVWPLDGTSFGMLGQMPLSSEGLAAGATIPPQALETAARLPPQDGDNFNDYTMSRPKPNAAWAYVTTDKSGHFALRGLSSRAYTLRVMHQATLQVQSSGPHMPGAGDVTIRLEAPDLLATLSGRVICRGQPMANVNVGVRCVPFDVRARAFGGTVELKFEQPGSNTRTDAQGRFTLKDVPKVCCHLILRGDSIVPRKQLIDAQTSPSGLDLEVDARCHVQVKLRAPTDRADAIAAVDQQGEPIELLVLAAGSTNAYTDMPLHDGQSEVFSLSSRAKQIVLLRDGSPVGRIDIDLQLDRVNVVEG